VPELVPLSGREGVPASGHLRGSTLYERRGFEHIIHRGGLQRRLREPVLHVCHHHAGPVGQRGCGRLQDIENGLRVRVVMNVGLDLVVRSDGMGAAGEQ